MTERKVHFGVVVKLDKWALQVKNSPTQRWEAEPKRVVLSGTDVNRRDWHDIPVRQITVNWLSGKPLRALIVNPYSKSGQLETVALGEPALEFTPAYAKAYDLEAKRIGHPPSGWIRPTAISDAITEAQRHGLHVVRNIFDSDNDSNVFNAQQLFTV